MSTASSIGSQWVPRRRPTSKSNARLRLIFKIRRDAQTREAPPPTLPRLSCLVPSESALDEENHRRAAWLIASETRTGRPEDTGGARRRNEDSKAITKLAPSDARNAYSIAQLKRMDRKFCRAMERAIRAGREHALAHVRMRSE
jgi:hypothetical protein